MDNIKIAAISNSKEITLRELISAVWKLKWSIILITLIFSFSGVFYSLSLPDMYISEVTLSPTSDSNSAKMPSQLGGLAALAGVNLDNSGNDKTGLAIEILKSREFLGRFLQANDMYVPIIAAEGWDRATDTLLVDPDIFDQKNKKWVRKVKEPFKLQPSNQETVKEFNKLFSVSQDKMSGLVKIRIEYYSPILAKDWVDKMVRSINEEMRMRDLIEAEKSIKYLNGQIEQTNLADIRTMLFSLIEEQMKTKMLTHARDEYILQTIDPAVIPELKSSPKRSLIVLVAFILGFIMSIMVAVGRFLMK